MNQKREGKNLFRT